MTAAMTQLPVSTVTSHGYIVTPLCQAPKARVFVSYGNYYSF